MTEDNILKRTKKPVRASSSGKTSKKASARKRSRSGGKVSPVHTTFRPPSTEDVAASRARYFDLALRRMREDVVSELNATPTGERRELITDLQIAILRVQTYDREH